MKNKKFIVVFTNGNYEKVFTGCKEEATILAQANQIKKGHS